MRPSACISSVTWAIKFSISEARRIANPYEMFGLKAAGFPSKERIKYSRALSRKSVDTRFQDILGGFMQAAHWRFDHNQTRMGIGWIAAYRSCVCRISPLDYKTESLSRSISWSRRVNSSTAKGSK
jgi:hypothetical protein